MDTFSPIVSGIPGSACSTAPSCTLVRAPTVMRSLSARTTAAGHTLAPSPNMTCPITVAPLATYADAGTWGAWSPNRYMVIMGLPHLLLNLCRSEESDRNPWDGGHDNQADEQRKQIADNRLHAFVRISAADCAR